MVPWDENPNDQDIKTKKDKGKLFTWVNVAILRKGLRRWITQGGQAAS